LTLPHSTQLAHSLRNISDYDTRWEERDGVLLYCHKGGRKGTTTEKKENIYIYKNPGIRLVVLSLFPRFFFFSSSPCHPQLLIDTHLSSALGFARTTCEGEKVVIFFFLFPYSIHTYTRARVYIHSCDKDLVCNSEFLKKSSPLDNSTTSIHATRHTNHILKKGCSADHRR
jgi:hypothetical protein